VKGGKKREEGKGKKSWDVGCAGDIRAQLSSPAAPSRQCVVGESIRVLSRVKIRQSEGNRKRRSCERKEGKEGRGSSYADFFPLRVRQPHLRPSGVKGLVARTADIVVWRKGLGELSGRKRKGREEDPCRHRTCPSRAG